MALKIVSPQQYKKVIDKITNSNMFKKTITINGKTQNISTFFNSMSDAYEYYHKVDGNKHFFAKIENRDGFLLIIDFSADVFLETFEDKTKEIVKNQLGLNKIDTKDEE